MTHDALRDYDELSPLDREQMRLAVEAEAMQERLDRSVDRALMLRELTAKELHVGSAVRLVGDTAGEVGSVIAVHLASQESGRIEELTVRWPDGEVAAYSPSEHAIELVLP
jgi:hypothetical protein